MSDVVTVHDAKTNLSELLRRVEAGEEIIIARGTQRVAVLRAYKSDIIAERRRAGLGSHLGQYAVPTDATLFEPLSEAELADAFGDSAKLFK